MRSILITCTLLFAGCEWEAGIAPTQQTIEKPTSLAVDLCGTWLPFNRGMGRVDEEAAILISQEENTLRYNITWPEIDRLKISATAMELKKNDQYALVDIEITDTETNEKTYRLSLVHICENRLCVWWVRHKKLKKRIEELGLKMEFETRFPLATTVKCKPEDLRAAVLSNPAAVVGEPELLYRKGSSK